MRKENTYILELCKFIKPNKDKIENLMQESLDYPYILGQLLFHRMGGVAYYTLKECELLGRVNREFRNSLKAIYDISLEKADSLETAIQNMVDTFEKIDFPYAMLKGALLVQIYPKGLRTSNDLDILLDHKDITALSNILKDAGFSQGNIRNGDFVPATRSEIISSRMNRGETVPFIKKVNLPKMPYLELDINFSLDYKAIGNSEEVDIFLEGRKPLIQNKLFTLAPDDFLIHLCVHLFKEATVINWVEMGRDLSLYKFCDIYLFVDRYMNTQFSEEIKNAVFKYGLQKECYYAFYHTQKLFDIQNYNFDQLINSIKPKDVTFMNEIIVPRDEKVYTYKMNFEDWIFCSNRKGHLNGITNDEAYA